MKKKTNTMKTLKISNNENDLHNSFLSDSVITMKRDNKKKNNKKK